MMNELDPVNFVLDLDLPFRGTVIRKIYYQITGLMLMSSDAFTIYFLVRLACDIDLL
jgi:hypothetical protein